MRAASVRAKLLPLFVLTLVLAAACEQNGPEERFPRPEPGRPLAEPTFGFVVIGDFGIEGPEVQAVAQDVRAWVERIDADALVTTGDNVYPDGAPDDFDEAWGDPYGWVDGSGVELVASLGNHDIRTDDGAPVMELFGMPDRWYAKSIGDADLFVLDANRPENEDQLAWMKDALVASDAEWKIAAFHQPAYSCSNHDGEEDVVNAWVPQFEREDMDLVLTGHDHNYQRFEQTDGVTYVVTGGGGHPDLYDLDACPAGYPKRVAGNDQLHHFLVVQGSAERLRVRAIAVDGTIIDDFSLHS